MVAASERFGKRLYRPSLPATGACLSGQVRALWPAAAPQVRHLLRIAAGTSFVRNVLYAFHPTQITYVFGCVEQLA